MTAERDRVDVKGLLGELRTSIESARALPMSSSAVINRTAVLDLISRLDSTLPAEFAHLHEVDQRLDLDDVDAQEQTDELDDRVSETDVYRAAEQQAAALRREAEQETAELRAETDEYVDGRLAQLELSLTKTLEAVTRGRARLHVRSHFDQLGESHLDGQDDE